MSSDVGRVFSSSGLMITDMQNRLKEEIIEAVEYMKSWSADSGIVSFKNTEEVCIQYDVGTAGSKKWKRSKCV